MPGKGTPAPTAGCLTVHFPYPPAVTALTAADAGRTVHLNVGDLASVTLLGKDAPGGRWPEIAISDDAVRALANPANAATVGTQLGEYCAARAGQSTLTSGPWTVTVDVGG
ncbi:MAG TPA: hypothetical protein VF137_03900 [Candidatus Dormibacteraeota bacterium]